MQRFALSLCLFCAVVLPSFPHAAAAQSFTPAQGPKPLAVLPILPLADGDHPDMEDLARRQWHGYYQTGGEFGLTMADFRASRFDLNDDGNSELIMMIDKPRWTTPEGKPFIIATWRDHQWTVIGGSWADDDNIFVTEETNETWRTLDTGHGLLRWTGKNGYAAEAK